MLRAKVSIDVADKLCITPLMTAARVGLDKIVSLLLQRKANPQLYNLYGESPIFLAARNNHMDTLKLLGPVSGNVTFVCTVAGRRAADVVCTYYTKEYLCKYMSNTVEGEDALLNAAKVRGELCMFRAGVVGPFVRACVNVCEWAGCWIGVRAS